MSRIGKTPVKVVSGAQVKFTAPLLEVSGKVGKLSREIPQGLKLEVKSDEIIITRESEEAKVKSLHGLTRSLVANMVQGVTEGFSKTLELRGVGYRAQAKGSSLNLNLGFSHPVDFKLPEGVSAKVDQNTKVTLSGADKQLVGETAAKIRKIRPPEPYKGKGVRYEGEQISLKQGKTAGK